MATLLACALAFPVAAQQLPDACEPAEKPASNAAIEIALDQATDWQPRNGQVRFAIKSKAQSLANAEVIVCFRWNEASMPFQRAVLRVIKFEEVKPGSEGSYMAAVPDDTKLPRLSSSWFGRVLGSRDSDPGHPKNYDGYYTVPMADMRVIVMSGGKPLLIQDGLTIGITSVWAARALALLGIVAALAVLWVGAKRRAVPGANSLLFLFTTRRGYASLSQFQIVLWTLLIGAGAIYVMTLSGSLLDIPTGALVLLGIAGATTVSAKIQSDKVDSRGATASVAPGPVQALGASGITNDTVTLNWTPPVISATAGPAATFTVSYRRAGATAWTPSTAGTPAISHQVTGLVPGTAYDFEVVAVNPVGRGPAATLNNLTTLAAPVALPVAADRTPQWSDLVMTPAKPGEIDVTRMQMLFFTLISAGFVAVNLFNSYVIPDIPPNFLLLMGISNGVYVTSKFVSNE